MSKKTIIQLLLVLAGVFLGLILWMAPRSAEEETEAAEHSAILESESHEGHEHAEGESDKDQIWENGLEGKENLKKEFEEAEARAEKIADVQSKLDVYDTLISKSIKENLPPYVALYSKKKAETVPTSNNWMLAGDNYFKAFRLSKNTSEAMLEGAVSAYQRALELDPDKLEAKTALGVAYVEGAAILGEMPMKGIGMLREVLNIDPENINALTNLGYFAIQSGQYEKAIERFKTVLSIDPRNAEAYLYLTDVYLSQGQKEEGIKTLKKYKELMKDPLVDQRVDQYIKEIRSN